MSHVAKVSRQMRDRGSASMVFASSLQPQELATLLSLSEELPHPLAVGAGPQMIILGWIPKVHLR